jgi:hypothetical protein
MVTEHDVKCFGCWSINRQIAQAHQFGLAVGFGCLPDVGGPYRLGDLGPFAGCYPISEGSLDPLDDFYQRSGGFYSPPLSTGERCQVDRFQVEFVVLLVGVAKMRKR